MTKLLASVLAALLLSAGVVLLGCGGEGSTIYHCTYETRHSGCGGGDWTAWTSECYRFDLEDYQEGWTPQRVCDKFSGSDTACESSCCIYVEHRNTTLAEGGC
jgi:hypothetical protein